MTDISASSRPALPVTPEGPWAEIAAARSGLEVGFVGSRWALFWLALKTGFFTILTLGFYRFWMKTRLRRWYWSAIRPGGHPMEYVGDPFEKLLGFFIAVVILTFYIGIINLLLMFVSFSVFNSSIIGYLASFAGVVPLWFYARYRARRYVLGRTRWRGVRFSVDPGAWGYAGRALMHWSITILTLGLLWPRMTFSLEKYRIDRTNFGSARLEQRGRWPMLYRAAVPFALALAVLTGIGAWLIWLDPVVPQAADAESFDELLGEAVQSFMRGTYEVRLNDPWRLLLVPLCLSGLIYGAVHYRWASKRIMANHKRAAGITAASTVRPVRVATIYVLGTSLSYMVLLVGIALMVAVGMGLLGAGYLLDGVEGGFSRALPDWLEYLLLAVLYFGVFLLWSVLHHTFVTYPLMRHMALTTRLPKTTGLAAVSQRKRDEFAEAEGFAEALDLGAAI